MPVMRPPKTMRRMPRVRTFGPSFLLGLNRPLLIAADWQLRI